MEVRISFGPLRNRVYWGKRFSVTVFKVKIKSAVLLQPNLPSCSKSRPVASFKTRFCTSLAVGAVRSLRKYCVRGGSGGANGESPGHSGTFASGPKELSVCLLSQKLANVHENTNKQTNCCVCNRPS